MTSGLSPVDNIQSGLGKVSRARLWSDEAGEISLLLSHCKPRAWKDGYQ